MKSNNDLFTTMSVGKAVANLFGIGANSLIARGMGMNDEATAKKASSFSFWGSAVITAVLAVILAIFMAPILKFAGADSLTYGPTRDYLMYVFVIGGIPTVAGLTLGHLVRAVGKTREASIGLAIGGIFIRRWSWCAIGMCLIAMYDSIFQAVGKWKTSLVVAVLRFLIVFPLYSLNLLP